MKRQDLSTAERLEAYSMPEPTWGCWLWTGPVNPRGYGLLYENGQRQKLAHRVSWEQRRGPIPAGLFVCHKCDVPSCINPDHHFLGTIRENFADMVRKGRHRSGRAPTNGRAKLTWEKAALIRADTRVLRLVAADYGVSGSVISGIRRGKLWKSRDVVHRKLPGDALHNVSKPTESPEPLHAEQHGGVDGQEVGSRTQEHGAARAA